MDATAMDADPGMDATAMDADPGMDATAMDADPGMDATAMDADPAPDAAPMDAGTTMDAAAVDAGVGAATLSATDLGFGRSVIGSSFTQRFTVSNNSGATAQINPGAIGGGGASDYSILDGNGSAPSMVSLVDGDSIEYEVTFQPSAVGPRNATFAIDLCGGACPRTVRFTGVGIREAIDCTPRNLAFGLVNPNSCASEVVTCTNTANHPATVVSAAFTAGTTTEFYAQSASMLPVDLSSMASEDITVDFCPVDFGNDNSTLVVTVVHPNPALSTKTVQVTGTGGGPDIFCSPSDVDLGVVAVGNRTTRFTSCTNVGNTPLLVSSVLLDSAASTDLSLLLRRGMTNVTPPLTLSAGQSLDVEVTLAASMAAMHSTSFTVSSNDRDSPQLDIDVTGEAISGAGCSVTFSSTDLEFGVVSLGQSLRSWVEVTNNGTGACAVSAIGIPGAGMGPFDFDGMPPSAALDPGESFMLTAVFTPSNFGSFNTTMDVSTSDPAQQMVSLNLTGTAGFQPLFVWPRKLDFGNHIVGCGRPLDKEFGIWNFTDSDKTITGFEMDGSSSSAFSASFHSGGVVGAESVTSGRVEFAPLTTGEHSGRVNIELSSGEKYFVNVHGRADMSGENSIDFGTPGTRIVDMLFLLDNTPGMATPQAMLGNAAQTLISRADSSGVDYHIGVTTSNPNPGGALSVGALVGGPSIIDASNPNRVTDLQRNLNAGTGGDLGPMLQVGSFIVTDYPLNNGNGPNAGFLRKHGELEIVLVSDSRERGRSTVRQWVDAMRVHPYGMTGEVRFHSISGGEGGCNAFGMPPIFAAPAPRLVEAARSTGGTDHSVCDMSYDGAMNGIADVAFGEDWYEFDLHSTPQPGTIEVTVNGAAIPQMNGTDYNWYINFRRPKIVFAPSVAPSRQDAVEISYTTFCESPTCGNMMVETGEECDDGNTDNTDDCTDFCLDAFCGDNSQHATNEQCDDGNQVPGDGCNTDCIVEGCGNGIIEPPEQCDNGTLNSDTVADACRTDCTDHRCGDNVIDSGEQCDDGNTIHDDACLGTCQDNVCGDGFRNPAAEQCDDGNTRDGDGCDSVCAIETTSMASLPGSSTVTLNLAMNVRQSIVIEVTAESYIAATAYDSGQPGSCAAFAMLELYDGSNGLVGHSASPSGFNNCPAIVPQAMPWSRLPVGRHALVVLSSDNRSMDVVIRGVPVDICGNGVTDGMEQCDDGNQNDRDDCSNSCTTSLTGYTVSLTPNVPWSPPAGLTPFTNFVNGNDDGYVEVDIPFDFDWTGYRVRRAYASTNGALGFDTANIARFDNLLIPSPHSPDAFIAMWWDDLNPSAGGEMGSVVTGASGSQVLHIVYSQVPHFQSQGEVNVEVRLYEGSNDIEVQYGVSGVGTGSQASVG